MAESIKPAVLQQILASAQGVHSDNTNCNCLICVVKKFVSTPEATTTNSGSINKLNCTSSGRATTTNTSSSSTAGSSNPTRGNNQKPIAVPSKDIKSTETDTSDDDDDWPPPNKKFNPPSDTAVKTKPALAEQQTPRRPRSPSTPRIGSARRSPPIAAHKRPYSSRNDNNNKKQDHQTTRAEAVIPNRVHSKTPVTCPKKPEVKNQILEVQKREAEKIAKAKKKGESVRKAAQLAEVYSQIGQTSRACAALFERLAALIKE